jgi:hypothetical protein
MSICVIILYIDQSIFNKCFCLHFYLCCIEVINRKFYMYSAQEWQPFFFEWLPLVIYHALNTNYSKNIWDIALKNFRTRLFKTMVSDNQRIKSLSIGWILLFRSYLTDKMRYPMFNFNQFVGLILQPRNSIFGKIEIFISFFSSQWALHSKHTYVVVELT